MLASSEPGGLDEGRRRLRWQYRLPLRYGPWAVLVVGCALVAFSVLADRDGALLVAALSLGTGLVVLGAVLPRIKGPLEFGQRGVKTELGSVGEIDVEAVVSLEQDLLQDQPASTDDMRIASRAEYTVRDIDRLVDAARQRGWEVRELASHTQVQRPGGEVHLIPRRADHLRSTVAEALERELLEDP